MTTANQIITNFHNFTQVHSKIKLIFILKFSGKFKIFKPITSVF